ncbi:unnamed protein product, partial [Iphiclides podalirius]
METSTVDEREDVQKKTFAKWINSQLVKNNKPLVQDLFQDLRDGEVLLSLLEILTAQQYRRERGQMRVHQLNNVNAALRALEAAGLRLVNISGADIVDGNPKLILGLVWSIILHWQVHYHLKDLTSDTQQSNLEKTLLAWCRTHTQNYAGVNIRNFTTSWADGLAFNALLHRWRPQLFDYAAVLRATPHARLDHAFALAHDHLAIARLLDPEDVNTAHPDKKSIMMYVMCLFQSLPHASDDLPEPVENAPASRPLSSATTASELGGYGAALEEALAWLLEAEERLAAQPAPPAADLAQLKEHFHAHERFLLELSEQQCRVGGVLEEGARLLREAALSRDEANEVRLQMRLLNERWEQLRRGAMRRQARVHAALMQAQHHHLQRFRQWLTETEDRMSRMEAEGADGAGDEAALKDTRELHADLRRQQPLVDALADCVVVVDDEAHDDGKARSPVRSRPIVLGPTVRWSAGGVAEIEDELRALGERWSHACQWTLARLGRLARRTQLRRRRDAAARLEADLKQMEASPVSEVGEVLARIEQLQRVTRAVRLERRAAARLLPGAERPEAGPDEPQHDEPEPALAEEAEALLDRLDALLLILDVQASRIRELGFEFDIETSEETTEGSPPPSEAPPEDAHSASKRPRLGRDAQAGFRAFAHWARDAERQLQQAQAELEAGDGDERRGAAAALLERLQRQLDEQRADFEHVEEIQRRLAAEPELQDEAQRHAASVDELRGRWEGVRRQLARLRETLELLEEKERFARRARALRDEMSALGPLEPLEMRLKELNAHSIVLLAKALPRVHREQVQDETRQLKDEYEEVRARAAERAGREGDAREAEFRALRAEVAELEAQIVAEHGVAATQQERDGKLEQLERLRARFDELQSTYEAVVEARRENCDTGSVSGFEFTQQYRELGHEIRRL